MQLVCPGQRRKSIEPQNLAKSGIISEDSEAKDFEILPSNYLVNALRLWPDSWFYYQFIFQLSVNAWLVEHLKSMQNSLIQCVSDMDDQEKKIIAVGGWFLLDLLFVMCSFF